MEAACALDEYSELEFSGLIKSFEIAFEMAWKTLKGLLMYEGFDVNSPRTTIQQAFDSALIGDLSPWIEALESRNVLSHNYDKKIAAGAGIFNKRDIPADARKGHGNITNAG